MDDAVVRALRAAGIIDGEEYEKRDLEQGIEPVREAIARLGSNDALLRVITRAMNDGAPTAEPEPAPAPTPEPTLDVVQREIRSITTDEIWTIVTFEPDEEKRELHREFEEAVIFGLRLAGVIPWIWTNYNLSLIHI